MKDNLPILPRGWNDPETREKYLKFMMENMPNLNEDKDDPDDKKQQKKQQKKSNSKKTS